MFSTCVSVCACVLARIRAFSDRLALSSRYYAPP